MGVIKKIFNRRDFIDRKRTNAPCFSVSERSGDKIKVTNFPYDVKVDGNFNLLPTYTCEESGETIEAVRFSTILTRYSWLRRFIMESRYYVAKKRKNAQIWAEIGANLGFEEKGGKLDLFRACNGVFSEFPEIEDFYCESAETICMSEKTDDFHEFFDSIEKASDFIDWCHNVVFSGKYESVSPSVEFSILIDSDIEDLGNEYFVEPEEFRPLYLYKEGDFVKHNGQYYRCKATMINPKSIFYDDDWEKLTVLDGSIERDTTYVESQLFTLLRNKTTVDYYGNVTDFISGSTYCELRYITGATMNIVYDSKIGCYTYNKMESIMVDGKELDDSFYQKMSIGDSGKIKFRYLVGCILGKESSEGEDGIEYTEEYDYVISGSPKMGEMDTVPKPYVKIDYDSGYFPEYGENGKRYAIATISVDGEEMLSANTFIRYDELIGTSDMQIASNGVNIERGASACYEAFNVIGEVNTTEDIEKYRDDWFRFRGKSD